MQPLKPYFLGLEQPPHDALRRCQKVFRTPDIENVGNTTRHLTFFEMLGNFSIGDYFKQGAVERRGSSRWRASGFDPERHLGHGLRGRRRARARPRRGGDRGLGVDRRAARADRRCARARRTSGRPARPARAGRAASSTTTAAWSGATRTTCPAARTSASWSTGTSSSCSSTRTRSGTLTPLPAQNIDTGLGLNRMAILSRTSPSVFETDQFAPLVELGARAGGRYGEPDDRALRILADHSRAMTFLIADGVVPSNEDRGYALRRVMRRAIQQGRALGMEPGVPAALHRPRRSRSWAPATPSCTRERDAITRWAEAEEAGLRPHARAGHEDPRRHHRARARSAARRASAPTRPSGCTTRSASRSTSRSRSPPRTASASTTQGFESADGASSARAARATARGAAGATGGAAGARRAAARPSSSATRRSSSARPSSARSSVERRRRRVKLAESPFYADRRRPDRRRRRDRVRRRRLPRCAVADVRRVGDDQAVVARGRGRRVRRASRCVARVDRAARHATQANHTATHLLHAALRERARHARAPGRLLRRARQAALRLHPRQRAERRRARAVEDRVNEWILRNDPVRADHDDARRGPRARRDGAVRREVRRRRADGRGRRRLLLARAVRRHARALDRRDRRLQAHDRDLERGERAAHRGGHRAARRSRCCAATTPAARGGDAAAQAPRGGRRGRRASCATQAQGGREAAAAGGRRVDVGGARRRAPTRSTARGCSPTVPRRRRARRCSTLADRAKGKLGDAAVVLGAAADGRVSPRGQRRAGAGRARRQGRRDRQGRGARSPAAAAAGATRWRRPAAAIPPSSTRRSPPRAPRSKPRSRRARCACSPSTTGRRAAAARVSDPTGTLATPIDRGRAPVDAQGLARLAELVARARGRARRRRPADDARRRRERRRPARRAPSPTRCAHASHVPVEMYDERFTTAIAARSGGASRRSEDSRAAAVMLEDWLVAPCARAIPGRERTRRRYGDARRSRRCGSRGRARERGRGATAALAASRRRPPRDRAGSRAPAASCALLGSSRCACSRRRSGSASRCSSRSTATGTARSR